MNIRQFLYVKKSSYNGACDSSPNACFPCFVHRASSFPRGETAHEEDHNTQSSHAPSHNDEGQLHGVQPVHAEVKNFCEHLSR